MIAEAARNKEALWITNSRALCGILIPVTPHLIQRLVNDNLSRILFNVERGEKDLANSQPILTLDEMMDPSQEMTR